MSNDNYNINSNEIFVPPGTIRISSGALQRGLILLAELYPKHNNNQELLVFQWADSYRRRVPNTNTWEDWGNGIQIWSIKRDDIPLTAFQSIEAIELAISIPSHIWERSRLRLIDTDPSTRSGLNLF